MAYVTGSYLNVVPFPYPRGVDRTDFNQVLRGSLVFPGPVTLDYITGGLGSNTFEVTAVTTAGVATFSNLLGVPLFNGQTVVLSTLTHNSGTFTISAVTGTTSGTFQLVNVLTDGVFVPIGTLTADSAQTGNGVGQLQLAVAAPVAQTFTVSAVTQSATQMKCTYSALVGPQVQPGQSVTLSGMSNAGNNGTFKVLQVQVATNATGFLYLYNPVGVTTDSGTGAAIVGVGSNAIFTTVAPTMVKLFSVAGSGVIYTWNALNQTVQAFVTGAGAHDALDELQGVGTGIAMTFDSAIQFEAVFPFQPTQ